MAIQIFLVFAIQSLLVTTNLLLTRKYLWMIELLQPISLLAMAFCILALNASGFTMADDKTVRQSQVYVYALLY